jgi:PAS domain S-box-containing protein
MDVRIQGEQDGIETAELLQRMFNLPVIYLTAYGDTQTVERAKRTAPLGYLLKPFKPKDLRSTVEIALHRHRLETELRERERWLQTVLDSIADGVVAADEKGSVSFLNSRAQTLLGRSPEECMGNAVEDVVRLRSWEGGALENPLRQALATRQPFRRTADSILLGPGGSELPINDTTAPILDDERLLGAVMAFRDVSEQRALRRELEFRDRLSALGTMAAGVAHEINNPLAIITANLELVQSMAAAQETLPVEDLKAPLQDAQRSAERIAVIVSDLGTFARPKRLGKETSDLKEVIAWATRATAHAFKDRARLETLVADLKPVAIERTRLEQVLLNLLLNAAHAITPGHPHDNAVQLHAHALDPDHAVIQIRDTGCGIPEHIAQNLFVPFVTGKPPHEGTGLGLFVCNNIVNSVGGRLEFDTELDVGTTFRVVLPLHSNKT